MNVMRILFFFVDGIGLGDDDQESNPFAAANTPTLYRLAGGQRWLADTPPTQTDEASFTPIDPRLGVPGRPQSATGQATIMTGINVPQVIGRHYGPKPDAMIASIIRRESVIKKLTGRGQSVAFLNAYPPGFFEAVNSGKRLLSANQLAITSGGVPLRQTHALYEGQAISADFTGEIWRSHLGFADTPLISPFEAGHRMAELARNYGFTFFDHWLTDYVGHRGTLQEGISEIERLDEVLSGILSKWDPDEGLIVLTSDHGNLEDTDSRTHTMNLVPLLVVGNRYREFSAGLSDLTGLAPRILRMMNAA